jgi:hypothetical protein
MTYRIPELISVGSALAVVLSVQTGSPTDNIISPTSVGDLVLGLDD